MAEWLKAHAWKACIGESLSRVRIPVSPPFLLLHTLTRLRFHLRFHFFALTVKTSSKSFLNAVPCACADIGLPSFKNVVMLPLARVAAGCSVLMVGSSKSASSY